MRGSGSAGSRRSRGDVIARVTVRAPGALERTVIRTGPGRAGAIPRSGGGSRTMTVPARVSERSTACAPSDASVTLRSHAALQRTGRASDCAGRRARSRGRPIEIRGAAGSGAVGAPSTAKCTRTGAWTSKRSWLVQASARRPSGSASKESPSGSRSRLPRSCRSTTAFPATVATRTPSSGHATSTLPSGAKAACSDGSARTTGRSAPKPGTVKSSAGARSPPAGRTLPRCHGSLRRWRRRRCRAMRRRPDRRRRTRPPSRPR